MWFLRDASGEKVSEFFSSQTKLAMHMQINPQTLQRAIKKGRNVFQFRGQEVRVVQETIPQFAVFDFPPSENPIETFELISEVAKWLKVPTQTVYAAVKRGNETKVKNKEGIFWLKKLSLPPAAVPPPVVPPPQVSPEGAAPPPIPPEVAEVIRAGKTFPFETSKKLEVSTFVSAAKLARFIKSGCGKMFVQGAKKHQTLICNGKMVFLPDLVREIIVFHIRDQMWKDDDGAKAFIDKLIEYNSFQNKQKDQISAGFLARVRKLDDETIEQICKEFMKMF